MSQHQTGRTVYAQLSVVVILWAANWPLMKLVLRHMPAGTFLVWRFAGTAAVMAAISILIREHLLPAKGERFRLAWIGIFQTATSMGLATLALQYMAAGRTTVLVYTMQLWALPLGWILGREKITTRAIAGSLIGFAGVILFVNPMALDWHHPRTFLGTGMALTGAISWAAGACFYRRFQWQTHFWTQAFWQILWSSVAITLVGAIFGVSLTIDWTVESSAILIYNWFAATALSYWFWARSLTVLPASKAGQFMSLVPVLAVILSAIFMGERVTAAIAISMALITAGIIISLRAGVTQPADTRSRFSAAGKDAP